MDMREKIASQTPEEKSRRLFIGATGTYYDIFNFQPWMINLHDIATGLSKKCRFNGQLNTDEIFSVAQHSVYVSRLVMGGPKSKLAGLLHDGSEGLMTDLITPMKTVMDDFANIEDFVQNTIYTHFNITMDEATAKEVHRADQYALCLEMNEFGRTPHLDMTSYKLFEFFSGDKLMGCAEAKRFFIDEFNSIIKEILTTS